MDTAGRRSRGPGIFSGKLGKSQIEAIFSLVQKRGKGVKGWGTRRIATIIPKWLGRHSVSRKLKGILDGGKTEDTMPKLDRKSIGNFVGRLGEEEKGAVFGSYFGNFHPKIYIINDQANY